MIAVLMLSFCSWSGAPAVFSGIPVAVVLEDPALDAKVAAAGKDVAKLLELAAACASSRQEASAKQIYKKVLELDAKNEVAHKGLNHQLYDGKWYESFAELSKYKREEDARMKLKGLTRVKDKWVPEADAPFVSMGWDKDEKGGWVNPAQAARAKQIEEWKAAGHEYRADDDSWIAPADLEKWKSLLWKCGEEWLDMEKANAFHAKADNTWDLAGEHFVMSTTCDWATGNLGRWHADKAHGELVRVFGMEPKSKPAFIVLNGLDQYNQVAGNTPLFPEAEGFSSLHGAYFADLFFDETIKPPQFIGCGVSYWDRKDAKVGSWGPLWLRWAAAQSFVDAIDPSWGAISVRIAGGGTADGTAFSAAFWREKRIPRWLRYGAASYVERFMKDPTAAEGADPWTLRTFACADIKKTGGLRKLADVFAFALTLSDVPGSSRLYNEAGLVVSFLLDGAAGNKELSAAHEAFRTALKSGTNAEVTAAVAALQKALTKYEREIKKYAGL